MASVTVFLSTYNGEDYIEKQLNSVLNQSNVDVSILIRDDVSTDETKTLLSFYERKYSNVHVIYPSKNLGPAKSFWTLLSGDYIEYEDLSFLYTSDYYAFCDQDDIWLDGKLLAAITKLETYANSPALYYSEATMVDKDLNDLHIERNKYQKGYPKFEQLIAENTAIGCTMVWNKTLQDIACKYNTNNIRMHDHFLHLICYANNGYIYHDNNSYILYRQHDNNVIGGSNSLKKYIKSIAKYLTKDSGLCKQALHLLNKEAPIKKTYKDTLSLLFQYKNRKGIGNTLNLLTKKNFYQNNPVMNLMIAGLIILNRF